MQLLDVPEDAPPEINRAAVQKKSYCGCLLCHRVEKAVEFLLWNDMIADWIWYWYVFKMGGSSHTQGMMKLKLSPDIM